MRPFEFLIVLYNAFAAARKGIDAFSIKGVEVTLPVYVALYNSLRRNVPDNVLLAYATVHKQINVARSSVPVILRLAGFFTEATNPLMSKGVVTSDNGNSRFSRPLM